MKAAKLAGIVLAGAISTMSVGQLQAEGGFGGLEKIKERWEKRFNDREAFRERIMADLKKQDAELEKVQTELKSASGEKKVDALATAVNALIDQHLETNKKMLDHLDKLSDKKASPESGSDASETPEAGTSPATDPDSLPAR